MIVPSRPKKEGEVRAQKVSDPYLIEQWACEVASSSPLPPKHRLLKIAESVQLHSAIIKHILYFSCHEPWEKECVHLNLHLTKSKMLEKYVTTFDELQGGSNKLLFPYGYSSHFSI